MFHPVFEDYEGTVSSETSSSFESSRTIVPPVRSVQPLDREVPTSAPQKNLAPPSVSSVPPHDPYPVFQRNGFSINLNSKQMNSVGSLDSVSFGTPKMKLNMVNQNVFNLAPEPFSPFNRATFTSAPRTAPPVPPTHIPTQPRALQGSGVPISIKSKQINSVGLSGYVISNAREKATEMVNQDVFVSAPRMPSPVPSTPGPRVLSESAPQDPFPVMAEEYSPGPHVLPEPAPQNPLPVMAEEYCPVSPAPGPYVLSESAPQNLSPVVAEEYFPQDVPRTLSPLPTVPPPEREYLPQNIFLRGSPEQTFIPSARASRIAPSPASSYHPPRDGIVITPATRMASPTSIAAPPNQDVVSLASRRASPVQRISPSFSHSVPDESIHVPLCSYPREVQENDLPMPNPWRPPEGPYACPREAQENDLLMSSASCPRLQEVQRSDLPAASLVPCPNPALHEIQESGLLAPPCRCSRLHTCQRNEATIPLVSYTVPHCEVNIPPTNPPAPQVDISNNVRCNVQINSIGLSKLVLSHSCRKKLDMINRLHSLGIQRVIDLPSIVVIGSQSAGKSSLIESISGINLPRSGGACTRCPTECRLVRTTGSEPWQCIVSLRFLTDEHGKPLDVAKNIIFGNIIKDPKDVEERLRRAQLAILNPSTPPEVLLNDDTQLEYKSIGYSSNIVSLEIKSPDATDLTFYDLPGLIACVPEGGRDESVEEIRELVVSYIRKQNCIILLTVACEVDFETQGAYRLAKKCDPEGIRTVGVLTKPDRIPEGEHSRWLKLIHNEISPLQHGWFCVKQLSTVELQRGYSFEKSRHICEKFFKTVAPWNTLDAVLCQKRLGTKALIVKLNELLMSVISERIPDIIQELLIIIQDTKDRIQALPAAPFSSNPIFEVVHLVNQLCDTLYNHSQGLDVGALGNQFEGIREVQETFRQAICETAPKFQPYARNAQLKSHSHLPCGLGTEAETVSTGETMYLDDVSGMALRAVTRELPGFYPFRVVQDLITCYTDKWKMPAFNLINGVFHIITEYQMRLVGFYFEKYTAGGLYDAVKNLIYGYMQARKRKLEKRIKSLIKLESSAFTLNNALFLNYKNDRLKGYEKVRQAYVNVDKDDFALTIITSVEAYFQVAHQRFVDNVPLTIDHNLVRIEKVSLQEVLYKGLELMGPNALESCTKLIAGDTQVSGLRAELEARLEELEAIQNELLDSD